jgi:hypothetical protein
MRRAWYRLLVFAIVPGCAFAALAVVAALAAILSIVLRALALLYSP